MFTLPPLFPNSPGTMVGGLTSGRVLIAQGAVNGAALAVSVALRYSAARPQFPGPDSNGAPVPILSYVTHHRR